MESVKFNACDAWASIIAEADEMKNEREEKLSPSLRRVSMWKLLRKGHEIPENSANFIFLRFHLRLATRGGESDLRVY